MIIATILGMYGQDISYYIDEKIDVVSPVYCLTILTVISIFLFLVIPILIYKFTKIPKFEKESFNLYLIINGVIGIPISFFSLFVLAMWWG
jgi:hypothetical protein